MITFYTAYETEAYKRSGIIVDIEYPENGKSPSEQIAWIEANCNKNISVMTYSPYILNALNYLLAERKIKNGELRAFCLYKQMPEDKIYRLNLCINDRLDRQIIDTDMLAEPMSNIYSRYRSAVKKYTRDETKR